ncbi:MAG: ABC transporter permease [Actinomycetota bacterium]
MQSTVADPEQTGAESHSSGSAAVRRKRLKIAGSYGVTVFLLVTLNFFLPRVMPGDPIEAMLASASSASASATITDEETRSALRRYYGLDRPLGEQYLRYLRGLAQGDLGRSIRFNRPVRDLIGERIPWTLLLGGTAMVIATVVGALTGIHSGWKRGGRLDRGLLAFFAGIANFPGFFVASMALFFFAVKLRWVPLGGATTSFADFGPWRTALDIARHLALPASIMGIQFAAGQYLIMRAGMVGQLGSDYLLLGRAKGLQERRLKYRYAARNGLLPLVSLTALTLSFVVAGAIFVERVFAYPGLGQLTFQAAGFRDYPLMQGTFLFLSVSVVSFNALADLALTKLDPRTAS